MPIGTRPDESGPLREIEEPMRLRKFVTLATAGSLTTGMSRLGFGMSSVHAATSARVSRDRVVFESRILGSARRGRVRQARMTGTILQSLAKPRDHEYIDIRPTRIEVAGKLGGEVEQERSQASCGKRAGGITTTGNVTIMAIAEVATTP